ncbi:jg549 [Pararge aegeria aegeria]|uniref:Jg549 protein n=1 Tax=Pararge aegeria aegeria TaxID=348720 RepID=A0A8S4QPE0_9NEOP|nr:jg549 [Pararge aegeria aegeria]
MSDRNVRKVVMATNIAENSVTIPGVVYAVSVINGSRVSRRMMATQKVKVFLVCNRNLREVATNIAETSVTIQGDAGLCKVYGVIDCGFHKLPHFDPAVGVECVSVCPVSKHNATQRAGRSGRTSRGKCYR